MNKKHFILTTVLCLLISSSYAQTVQDLKPTVTMKEYVDMQAQMIEKMNALRDEHQRDINRIKDEQIKTAYASQDKRLDGMNEFRQALQDSNKTYITKSELFLTITTLLGIFFAYSGYKRNQQNGTGKNVEVKK